MATNQILSAELFETIPALNVTRTEGDFAGIIGDISNKADKDLHGLIYSLGANGWLPHAQGVNLPYRELTEADKAARLESVRQQAMYWIQQQEIVISYEDANDDTGGEKRIYQVGKQDVIRAFLELKFQLKKKDADPEATALVREIRKLAGLADVQGEYAFKAIYVVAACNRRIGLSPLAYALAQKINPDTAAPLQISTAMQIPADNPGAFISSNLVENDPHEVGRKKLRNAGRNAAYVQYYKVGYDGSGAVQADYGKRDAAHPYRLHLISTEGKNDNSAMGRAFLMAKFAAVFPELGIYERFTTYDENGRTPAIPSVAVLSSLQTNIGTVLTQHGFGGMAKIPFNGAKYPQLMALLKDFFGRDDSGNVTKHEEIYKDISFNIRKAFGMAKTAEDLKKEAEDEAAEAAAEAEAKAKPDAAQAAAATVGVHPAICVLMTYATTGKYADLAAEILTRFKEHAEEIESALAGVMDGIAFPE